MVSGIMGALDIAPTLHFLEPGLKINGEEWTKEMDEYIVPTCAALTERRREFVLLLDNAPSHTCRLVLLQNSVARHSRVSIAVFTRPLSL